MSDGLGYRIDDENKPALMARSVPVGLMAAFEAPAEIDHRAWLRVENQGQMGSCVGNSLSSCLEICNFIATAGATVQLSRMFAYLTSQKECGMLGQDQGATIDGAAKASTEYGICLESTMPYPNPVRYSTTVPTGAYTEGAEHKANKHSICRNYDAVFQFLSAGLGAVQIGIDWVPSLINTTGIVERLSGRSVGGHALCLAGYSPRKDSRGRQYIWLVNSHGTQWGNKGWAEIAPAVVDQWGSGGQVMIGVSDLNSFGPRSVPSYVGMDG